jgi:hypothetical protein
MRKGAFVALLLSSCTFDGLDGYTSGDGGSDASVDVVADAKPDAISDAAPDTSDAPPPPCNLGAPFGTPMAVSSLNTTMIDGQAALSPDELTVYFTSNRLNKGSNVFTASRSSTSAAFGTPAALTSLNFTGADTWNVTLTGDGLTAYLVTDQNAADHMYKATRASSLASFGTPTLMPAPAVTGEQPFVTPDGAILYYSDNSGTKGQIVRDVLATASTAVQSSLVVGTHDVGIPVVDPTETVIFYAVYDRNVFSSYDIYTATRAKATDPWGTPAAVSELNTSDFEVASWISADKCEIWFTRSPPSGDWNIYVARRP